jgi:hypothetical protein
MTSLTIRRFCAPWRIRCGSGCWVWSATRHPHRQQGGRSTRLDRRGNRHHLRTLAKYGFVKDAEPASARERPWRLTEQVVSFSWDAQDSAGRALPRVAAEWFDHLYRYLPWMDEFPPEVGAASSATEQVLHATRPRSAS